MAARIVDHHVGHADLAFDQPEQPLDVVGLGGVAGKGLRAGLGAECAEFFDFACRQRDTDALAREQPRERGAEAFAGADDQGRLVFWRFHLRLLILEWRFQPRNPARQPAASRTGSSAVLSATSAYLARSMPSDRA